MKLEYEGKTQWNVTMKAAKCITYHIKYSRVTVGTTKKSIFVRNLLSVRRAPSSTVTTSCPTWTFSVTSIESLASIILGVNLVSRDLGPRRALWISRLSLSWVVSFTVLAGRNAGFPTSSSTPVLWEDSTAGYPHLHATSSRETASIASWLLVSS
jgi:hypothetical protein